MIPELPYKIAQVYFEDSQRSCLSPLATPVLNSRLSPYFENAVIVRLVREDMFRGVRYSGVLSWRVESKNNFSLARLIKELELGADVYVPRACAVAHDVRNAGDAAHRYFSELFEPILENLGLESGAMQKPRLGVYQNAVIARREIYYDYVQHWLAPSMDFLDRQVNPEYLAKLRSDPGYNSYPPGRQELLRRVIGTPHYQYHPFLLERLWSVYLWRHQEDFECRIV